MNEGLSASQARCIEILKAVVDEISDQNSKSNRRSINMLAGTQDVFRKVGYLNVSRHIPQLNQRNKKLWKDLLELCHVMRSPAFDLIKGYAPLPCETMFRNRVRRHLVIVDD